MLNSSGIMALGGMEMDDKYIFLVYVFIVMGLIVTVLFWPNLIFK